MTDIPPSDNTCILVAVDLFSKACRIIQFKGLPTIMETGEALFHHVFHNFGLDIVLDRGQQFTALVWKKFFQLLRLSVCFFLRLSSSDQWLNRTQESGNRTLSAVILSQPSTLLELFPTMG